MDRTSAARDILLLGAFEEARDAAAKAGVEVAALKGAALLELGLYQPGERGMTDADVLVRPADLEAFEGALRELGYRPMPNSADAWVRPSAGEAPPAVIDVHTGLWHIRDTDGLFSWGLEPGPGGLALNREDLFLHAAVHPLLHHGELTARAIEDCARLAMSAPGDGEKFWAGVSRKSNLYGIRPAVWPAVRRLAAGPCRVPERALEELRPRGAEKIKAALFERAALRRSRALEYLLPVLLRPSLLARYAVPDRRFMERRYGSASAFSYARRFLGLLAAVLRRS
ncbi:MAG: nucleotidyltransferase family protein [Elusimicrobia bacterium]|nr:nucleotidyltransferase family protein [Elusimicrobiota bacterium]